MRFVFVIRSSFCLCSSEFEIDSGGSNVFKKFSLLCQYFNMFPDCHCQLCSNLQGYQNHSRKQCRVSLRFRKFQMVEIPIRPIKFIFFWSKPFQGFKNFSKILIFRYRYLHSQFQYITRLCEMEPSSKFDVFSFFTSKLCSYLFNINFE